MNSFDLDFRAKFERTNEMQHAKSRGNETFPKVNWGHRISQVLDVRTHKVRANVSFRIFLNENFTCNITEK